MIALIAWSAQNSDRGNGLAFSQNKFEITKGQSQRDWN